MYIARNTFPTLNSKLLMIKRMSYYCSNIAATPQITAAPPCVGRRIDFTFIVDKSGSVSTSEFEQMKKAMIEMIKTFDIDSGLQRVGMINFGSSVNREFLYTRFSNKNDIINYVNGLTRHNMGSTYTNKALDYVRNTMKGYMKANAEKVAILVTDGRPTNPTSAITAGQRLRSAGVSIKALAMDSSFTGGYVL